MASFVEKYKYQIVVAIIVIIVAIALAYYFLKKKKKESYSNIGAIDNIGSLDSSYELVAAPEDSAPASHFADLIDSGDQMEIINQPKGLAEHIRPMERLERLQGSDLLPRISANVTPYNIDIAQPQTWAFSVNAPRVQLKDPIKMLADPLRGDVAIRYIPDVALIGKSQYGRDSWRGDGFFSEHFAHLYNKYTTGYKNMPLKTSIDGTIMDYSG